MNIINFLVILIACINVYCLFRNFDQGVIFYLILSFLMPNLNLVCNISYELLLFPFIIVTIIAVKKKIAFNKECLILFIYFLIYSVATAESIFFNNSCTLGVFSYFGIARNIILFLILVNNKYLIDNFVLIIRFILVANIIASIIQLMCPKSWDIFALMYGKESFVVWDNIVDIGSYGRAMGTVGTIMLGYFSLVSSVVQFRKIKEDNKLLDYLFLVLSLLCGVLSLSKVFILGIPIILLAYMLINCTYKFKYKILLPRLKENKIKALLLSITSLFLVWMFILFVDFSDSKFWYFRYIVDPFAALETRYSSNGFLNSTKSVILENPILGVGATNIRGEFTGDSLYITLLHSTGIIGLSIIMTFLTLLIIVNYFKSNILNVLLIFVVLLAGFAMPSFFNKLGVLIIAFVVLNKNHFEKREDIRRNYG